MFIEVEVVSNGNPKSHRKIINLDYVISIEDMTNHKAALILAEGKEVNIVIIDHSFDDLRLLLIGKSNV